MSIRTILASAAMATAFGVGGVAVTAAPASAYVACNRAGECWHVDRRYHYAPEVGVVHHPDDWYFHHDWAHDQHMHWREHHDGRGYYRDGVWIPF